MGGFFYRNARLTALVIGLVVVAGLGALQALPRQEDPTLARRFGTVTTFYPGATAQRVESLVTEPIEERLQELHEIAEIESLSRSGVSVIRIELQDRFEEEDVDEIWSKVRDRINDPAAALPPGVIPPEFEDQTSTAVTLLVGLSWADPGEAPLGLVTRLARELESRLRNVANTKETELFGEADEEIRVTIDPQALASLGLTAGEVSRAIARADAKLPSGALRSDAASLTLEVAGELETLERIRAIPVRQLAGGQALRVGDVAQVEKTVRSPAASEAWLHGRRGVAVAATMEPNHRVDVWADRAHEVVEGFRSVVPAGVAFEVLFDQSSYTEERLGTLASNLGGSALLVLAVLLVLMGVRSALIVATALPLTVAATLAELNALGVPLHQTSITGLIVAIGILIDNAIIAVDEFDVRLRGGASRFEAARSASRYLAVPLAASTLTTVLAFLPIVLMPGGAGEFVGPIAIGVILSVATSFVLALTVVPALAAFFAPTGAALGQYDWRHHGLYSERLERCFRAFLRRCLERPALGIAVSVALPVLGFAVGQTLPEQFFPANDRNQFQVQVVLPPHASIEETRRTALRVRERIEAHPDVVASHWVIGESAPRVFYNMFANNDGLPSFAGAFVTTRSADATLRLLPRLQAELIAAFPGARVLALPFEQGPPFDAPIEARIVGPDLETLRRLGEELRAVLARTQGVTFTSAKLAGGEPKLVLAPDESAARLAGLGLADIADQLRASLEGATGGTVIEANEEIPVRVRVGHEERASAERLAGGRVLAPGGAAAGPGAADAGDGVADRARGASLAGVPIGAIARIELVPELAGITRRNGERVNTVQAFLVPYTLISESLADFEARLAAAGLALPEGYRLELGGESEQRNEALGKLMAFALPLFVLMGGSIVLSFDSFRMAGVIFAVAFLSVGLGQLGVWLFGHPMGFVAIVGTMGLVGVAINDSIVVLSALRADARALAGEFDASVEVVVASARHVLATTLTTIGGFVPLLVWGGRFWPPMAAAIAVGVAGSTIVALLLVPAVHCALQRRAWRRAPAGETQAGSGAPAAAVPGVG
jgi:multidrug efflux pump subunit AcrB